MCPLYCYEDVHDYFVTHVATRRPVTPCPELHYDQEKEEFTNLDEYNAWMHSDKEYVDYNLPYDGQSFNDDTLEDMKDRILMLQAAGYEIPDWLIPSIDEELSELS